MVTDSNRVKEIFLEAAEQPDEAARVAYLDRACDGDAWLRDRVEALLRSHDPAGSFLGSPAVKSPAQSGDTHELGGNQRATPYDANDLHFLSPSTRPDSLGRLGHYEMLQVLGKGGFGIVFRAFDDNLQRVVAVKVMAPQIATLSPARRRFLREAQSSAQIRHDNVVQVYEVGEQPLPYLVMEFVPGETLQQKLDRSGPLEVSEVLRIGRQLAEGLAAAHACDLIHRDIKPGNVLLEGGSHKVKVTDFGLARTADDASISQSGIIAGTPMFMSPEQALGHHIDRRADLFSLGSVLYQMASGRPPFRAPSALAVLKRVAEDPPRPIAEIIPETPDWLCGIITKLHAKNREDRFQSARELADLLADCEAKLKAKQEVKNVRPAAVKPAGRTWVAAAAVLLLLVIALAVTEFAGVTHVFRTQQAMLDPSKPDGVLTPIQVAKLEPPPLADAWVQLFNGKDLTEWNHTNGTAPVWKVEDGNLVARGAPDSLLTNKSFSDFHCRIEAKINEVGWGNLAVRHGGAEGAIATPITMVANRTGGLWRAGVKTELLFKPDRTIAVAPDTWMTIEIIVRDKSVTVRVNGTKTCDRTIDSITKQGKLVISQAAPAGVLTVRKIEIKELPSIQVAKQETPPPDTKPTIEVAPPPPTVHDTWIKAIAFLPLDQHAAALPTKLKERLRDFDDAFLRAIPAMSSDRQVVMANAWLNERKPAFAGYEDAWFKAIPAMSADTQATLVDAWLKERRPAFAGLEVAWHKAIPVMSADVQAVLVATWLRERNPSFEGEVTPKIEGGVLTGLEVPSRLVQDLTPLRTLPGLKTLICRNTAGYDNQASRDVAVLRSLKKLENINGKPVAQFWKDIDAEQTKFQEWLKLVPALAAEQQVKLVFDKLKERNPGFDGMERHKIENEAVTEFSVFVVDGQDPVTDISPVRALAGLKSFRCTEGPLSDLSPLQGMQLTTLNLTITKVQDLAPLKGMGITSLHLYGCRQVEDLTPLKGMPLVSLDLTGCPVSDLSPLQGMPLTLLQLNSCTRVSDLSPLQGMPLEDIRLTPKNIAKGLDILRGMTSLKTIGIGQGKTQAWPAAEFWERYDKGEFTK